MAFPIGNNLSAIRAFSTGMSVTANNVANANSDGFKKSRAVMEAGLNDAVKLDIQKVDVPGPVIFETRGYEQVERELSNVDLGEEIPRTIPLQRGFEANIKMFQTQDEMLGTIIDMIG